MRNATAYLSYVRKAHVGFLMLLAMLVLPMAAFANDAPGSHPYQGDQTQGTDHAAFNIFSGDIPGVPSNAGEQDFVTVAPSGTLNWTNDLEICNGRFDIAFYLHNGAETSTNGQNLDGPGVATGVRMKITLPSGASMTHDITGTISADNVATIVDEAMVHCDDHDIELDYVEGSAQIFRQSDGQFDPLSDDIVGPNGTLVGSSTDNGVVPGCWEFRVIVKLTVDVKKVEKPEPIFVCKTLTALPTSVKPDEDVEFTATANAENGATITSYVFNFGDGNSQTVTTSAETASTTHAYDAEGNFNSSVTVNFSVDGQAKADSGDKCKVKVSVDEKEKPVCPTNPDLPLDSPKCDEEPETPPELPNTGVGSALAGFFGTSALFASAKELLNSRRQLRISALKR